MRERNETEADSAGFKELERVGEVAIMENDYSAIQPPPPYVDLRVRG